MKVRAHIRTRAASSAAIWLAILWCLLAVTPAAQPLNLPPGPAAAAAAAAGAGKAGAGAAAAGAAECGLYLLGGEDGTLSAGMRCTGVQPTIALAPIYLATYSRNFTGTTISSSCSLSSTTQNLPVPCLVTICAGSLVLRSSSVSLVRSTRVGALLCVAGESRVVVHDSRFTDNFVRPLAVFDQAHLVLNRSTISGNFVRASGAGLRIFDHANVTITGSSRVFMNTAGQDGGGLMAEGDATLTIDGNSSVVLNSAGLSGGGLLADGNASITVTGGSSVLGNAAKYMGGGLLVQGNASFTLTGASSVEANIARNLSGGGLLVMDTASVTVSGGSRVHRNVAGSEGGGLAAFHSARIAISGGSSVYGNTVRDGPGGGLFVGGNAAMSITGGSSVYRNSAHLGGGLSVENNAIVTLADQSSVHSNTAVRSGGGLSVWFNATVLLTGGVSVDHNEVRNGAGGGLHVAYGARVTISNQSNITSNRCFSYAGGGIAVDLVSGHVFDTSGRVSYSGAEDAGGMNLTASSDERQRASSHVTISNSTVSNNTSILSAGGGLAVGGNGTLELIDGTVLLFNSAVNSSGGGVVLLESGAFGADDSVLFVNNTVSKGNVGSTIAAFANSTLNLPLRGHLTKCHPSVYLGSDTCREGEVLQHDMCLCCPQHMFSFTNASCEPCPRNGNCFEGSLVEPLPGYWSSAATSVQMHRCPLSTTACNYTAPDDQCNEGYTGPLCGACTLPQYGMLSPFSCGLCMQPKVQLALYLLLSFVTVFFVTWTVDATWTDNLTGKKAILPTDLIKVLVLFLQYTVIIGSVAVPWPLFDMQRWFQVVNVVFAVGSGQALSLDCWLYHYMPQGKLPLALQRQLVYFAAAVVVFLAVVVLQWLYWLLMRWVVPLVWRPRRRHARQLATKPASLVVRKLPVTLLVVTFYAFPTLLRASLNFFACLPIDRLPPIVKLPPGATARLNHTAGYWVSDITQECFAGYHRGWALGLGLPSILLWCIAVPIAMGVGLFLCRAKADEASFREHFGFLYRSYRPERMWWEAVWAARTVVLTLISVFAFPVERYYAVLSLHAVFLVSAALQIYFQPYAFAELHRMHMVSTSCLAATTLGALAMFAYDVQESTALRLRIATAVLVMAVNVAFVGWCLWKLLPVVKGWCPMLFTHAKRVGGKLADAATACIRRPAKPDSHRQHNCGPEGTCV